VFVIVPKYPLSFMTLPFCVCFIVFYILNRQVDLHTSMSLSVLQVCCVGWFVLLSVHSVHFADAII